MEKETIWEEKRNDYEKYLQNMERSRTKRLVQTVIFYDTLVKRQVLLRKSIAKCGCV